MDRLWQDKIFSDVVLEKKKKETRFLELNITVSVEKIFDDFKLFFKNLSWINTYIFFNVEEKGKDTIDFQSLYRQIQNSELE